MSATAHGNMKRGRRDMTSLLLLALIACLAAGNVVPTNNTIPTSSSSPEPETFSGEEQNSDPVEDSVESTYVLNGIQNSTSPPVEDQDVSPFIVLIPVSLAIVVIAFVVTGIMIHRRLNRKTSRSDNGKEDPFLDSPSSEKVPMPMFEEDVPSVLELEMADLEQWMNKDGSARMDPGPV